MNRQIYNKKLLFNTFSYLLQYLVKWVPRQKNKWAFGENLSFKDNPKFLFYWTCENHPEIRSIWISHHKGDASRLRRQGFEAYNQFSLKGMYHALTSKVFISDHHVGDINHYLSGGCFYVDLWHGVSLKKVRWQAPDYYVRKYKLRDASEMRTSFLFKMQTFPFLFRQPDLCLVPSKIQAKDYFSQMLDISLDKCIVSVYPRSRFLIEGKDSALDFIKKYEPQDSLSFVNFLQNYNKVYIYMPTWRNNKADFITEAGFDWEELNELLVDKNSLFILRLHPFTNLDLEGVSRYSHIKVYPAASDIYTILPFVDCLITDYSSIYTDFLIMNKEIILFIFDYDEYVKSSYDLPNYDKYYLGKRVYDFSQLLDVIGSSADCHITKEQRDPLMKYFWDGNQSKIDIVEEIKNRI